MDFLQLFKREATSYDSYEGLCLVKTRAKDLHMDYFISFRFVGLLCTLHD